MIFSRDALLAKNIPSSPLEALSVRFLDLTTAWLRRNLLGETAEADGHGDRAEGAEGVRTPRLFDQDTVDTTPIDGLAAPCHATSDGDVDRTAERHGDARADPDRTEHEDLAILVSSLIDGIGAGERDADGGALTDLVPRHERGADGEVALAVLADPALQLHERGPGGAHTVEAEEAIRGTRALVRDREHLARQPEVPPRAGLGDLVGRRGSRARDLDEIVGARAVAIQAAIIVVDGGRGDDRRKRRIHRLGQVDGELETRGLEAVDLDGLVHTGRHVIHLVARLTRSTGLRGRRVLGHRDPGLGLGDAEGGDDKHDRTEDLHDRTRNSGSEEPAKVGHNGRLQAVVARELLVTVFNRRSVLTIYIIYIY
jgi:hypothetical protein